MRILGIETSCDETAIAVVRDGRDVECAYVRSQIEEHRPFGSVVPEIASRSHLTHLPHMMTRLEQDWGPLKNLDAIAVTARPGLIGSLLVGVSMAKGLAYALDIPLVDIHHVEAHAYAAQMEHAELTPPFIALIVSGGHTALYMCAAPGELEELGSTRDDAAGEAFDKVASLLGLPYPGGPAIQKAAETGEPGRETFSAPRLPKNTLEFSFSGLKTAVLYRVAGQNVPRKDRPPVDEARVPHLAMGFQEAAVRSLVNTTARAAERHRASQIAVGGGVACNRRLREAMQEYALRSGRRVYFPSPPLCVDNAVMIAGLGYHRVQAGRRAPLDLDARPN